MNWSPTSQTCHQHIWSPTSVTNIDVTVHNNQVYGAMGFSVRFFLFGLIFISQLEGSTIVCTDSELYNPSILQSLTIEILNTDFLSKFWRYNLYSICRLEGPGPTWSSISQIFLALVRVGSRTQSSLFVLSQSVLLRESLPKLYRVNIYTIYCRSFFFQSLSVSIIPIRIDQFLSDHWSQTRVVRISSS